MAVLEVPFKRRAPSVFDWNREPWRRLKVVRVAHFRPESHRERPRTGVKLFHTGEGLWGLFKVSGETPRCVHTLPQSPVYRDSCVEFFLWPPGAGGYFNFEWNALGTMLAGFVTDPERVEGKLKGHALLTEEEFSLVRVFPSPGCGRWSLGFFIPFSLISRRTPHWPPHPLAPWRCNFYKCGDDTGSPHWASWTTLPARNFHLPEAFGALTLVGAGKI